MTGPGQANITAVKLNNVGEPLSKGPKPGKGMARWGDGILYVEPAKQRFTITGATSDDPETKITYAAVEAMVPQAGTYVSLPVRAGFGQKSVLVATFAEDGSLLTGAYTSPKAAAKAVADSVKAALDQAQTTRVAAADQELKSTQNALALLKAKADLAAATAPAAVESEAQQAYRIELAKVQAQIALSESYAKLARSEYCRANPSECFK